MAEENSVELDTDGVQEETLSVAEQKLEEKPEKIDVDFEPGGSSCLPSVSIPDVPED